MPVAYLILGLMLLFIGRQIFWLFWGILGFAYGMEFGARLFPGQSGVTVLLFAFVLGIAGGLGAIILQRFAFGLGGFMAGGLAFFYIANELGLNGPAFPWVSFLAGGLLGFLLTVFLFDWTLMVLSAVLGVALIFESIGVSGLWTWAAAAALFAVGVTFQAQVLSRT